MKILEFFIDITVRGRKAEAGMERVNKKARGTKKELQGVGAAATAAGARLGAMALGAFSVGRAISSTVSAGARFQQQMKSVGALTGATGAELQTLSDKARELGRTTKFSATEAAEGIEVLARNGLQTEQILGGALDATLLLAAAMGKDLGSSADFMTDVMGQFGIAAGEAEAVVNKLAGAAKSSKFDMTQLWQAFAQGGGTAASLGVELDEFLTVISAISPAFKSGSDAGTSFKTLMTRLPGLTAPAQAALSELNMEFFNTDGSLKDMPQIIEQLRNGLSGLEDEAKITNIQDIFGVDAMRAALALANVSAEEYEAILSRINETSAQQMADQRMEGLLGSWKELQSAIESVQITLFNSGSGTFLEGMVDKLTAIVREIDAWIANNQELLATIGEVAAAIAPWVAALLGVRLAVLAIKMAFRLLGVTAIFSATKSVAAWKGMSAVGAIVKALGSSFLSLGKIAINQAKKAAAAWALAASAGESGSGDLSGKGKKGKLGKLGKVGKLAKGAGVIGAGVTAGLILHEQTTAKGVDTLETVGSAALDTFEALPGVMDGVTETVANAKEEFGSLNGFIEKMALEAAKVNNVDPETVGRIKDGSISGDELQSILSTITNNQSQNTGSGQDSANVAGDPSGAGFNSKLDALILAEQESTMATTGVMSSLTSFFSQGPAAVGAQATPQDTTGAKEEPVVVEETTNVDASVSGTNIAINVTETVDDAKVFGMIKQHMETLNRGAALEATD